MVNATKRNIEKYKMQDRVKLIEGPAQDTLGKLSGVFDIVFVDADKEGYEGYVKHVLDRKLLAPNGIIICDNGKLSTLYFAKDRFLSMSLDMVYSPLRY